MFWTEYSRDVVLVTGPDAFTYLQSQLSQELRPLQVGQSVWSFVLQPTGKVDVLLRCGAPPEATRSCSTPMMGSVRRWWPG
jgi:folate-binding Fe-S cluster repair protein YgfZ